MARTDRLRRRIRDAAATLILPDDFRCLARHGVFTAGRVRAAGRVIALLWLAAAPVQAQRQDPLRGLETYIERAREDWGVAGVAVAVVRNDSVVFARGFGEREAGSGAVVDEHTLFAIGSNTKVFTAAAIGLLVDAGSVKWDDPVTTYLPEFQLYDPYVTREMTLRDVLSHRSGLGRRGDMIWYAAPFNRAEVIRRVRHLAPSSSFRAEYGYQNIMFITAGEVAARVAGMSWDDFVTSRLLAPLGMRRSNTSTTQLAKDDNVATPHTKVAGRPVPIPWRNIDNAGPAGSINSSVAEMSQWLRTLLSGGVHDGRRILSAATVRELQRPHTITGSGSDPNFPMSNFSFYGLGLGLRDYYGRKLAQHTGGIDGMLSNVALIPEEQIGVVVLTNTDGQGLGSVLVYHIIDRLLDSPERDWHGLSMRRDTLDRQRADSTEAAFAARRVTGTRPSLQLEQYAGAYESELYGEAAVALEDGSLVLRRHDTFNGSLEHWHYDTFRAAWSAPGLGRSLVTFELNAVGRVASMQISGVGEFRRKE